MTIVSAAIVSRSDGLVCAKFLPTELRSELFKVANDFLYSLKIEDGDVELPYLETTSVRYVYKQTEDLYWVLVTAPESDVVADIRLLGRFVTTIMEYGPGETNSQTITDEQCDLFYRHIWRPWDDEHSCNFCGSNIEARWTSVFESRVQFLIDIRDGKVEESDVVYFNSLVAESWIVASKLWPRWSARKYLSRHNCLGFSDSDEEGECSNDSSNRSIGEDMLIDGCRMKCRMEDLHITIGRLEDRYLRLFARRDLLDDLQVSAESEPQSSAPMLRDLDSFCGQNSTMLVESSPNRNCFRCDQ